MCNFIETAKMDSAKKTSSKRKKTPGGKRERRTCTRWTQKENTLLLEAIKKFGERNWSAIAQHVGTKNGDQCNQHWHRVLDPKICKTPWTDEEDEKLLDRVKEHGESAWKRIAEGLPGRTDIQCRHRWMMRKKYISKDKLAAKTKNPAKSQKQKTNSASTNENSEEPGMLSDSSQESVLSSHSYGYDDLEDTNSPLRECIFSEPEDVQMEEETLEISKTSNRIREQTMDGRNFAAFPTGQTLMKPSELYVNLDQTELEFFSLLEPCFTGEPAANLTDNLMMEALEQWHCFLTENESSSPSTEVDSIADSVDSDDDSSDTLNFMCSKRSADVALDSLCNSPKKRRRMIIT